MTRTNANRFQGVLRIAVLLMCAAPATRESRGAEGVVLYVATDGNDAWSGRLPAPNTSRSDGPWATLQRARDGIRQLKQSGPLPQGGVVVELAGASTSWPGRWNSSNRLGTDVAPIVYRARQGAEVRCRRQGGDGLEAGC